MTTLMVHKRMPDTSNPTPRPSVVISLVAWVVTAVVTSGCHSIDSEPMGPAAVTPIQSGDPNRAPGQPLPPTSVEMNQDRNMSESDAEPGTITSDAGVEAMDSSIPMALDMGQQQTPMDSGIDSDSEPSAPEPEPEPDPGTVPSFDHFSTVLDLARSDQPAWAYFIYVDKSGPMPRFVRQNFGDRSSRVDFWPASTIKMYTATAALELLTEWGASIDAEATFYRQTNEAWVEDVTLSFREIIHDTFNCSSNQTYTLLLRFAGLDWINTQFFLPEKGFQETTLMRGYVLPTDRPYGYVRSEPQRIIVRDNGQEWMREHTWSERSYANDVGCTIYNESGTANCTSARDMAEHLRRIMFHGDINDDERFNIAPELLSWYRGGGPESVLNNTGGNNCGGPAYDGVTRVFPNAAFHHKGGSVMNYRSSIHHVRDPQTGTEYVTAFAVNSGNTRYIRRVSEEIARMAKTPGLYVELASLRDNVNPVRADLVVVTDVSGTLDLITKPFAEDGFSNDGWTPLDGTETQIPVGTSAHSLRSACLDRSEKVHIRGRFRADDGRTVRSDLHYVIVDHDQPCAN